MRILCLLLGGPLFLAAVIGHVMVRIRMKSEQNDFDDIDHEFEETDPIYTRYSRWYQWTLWLASAALLLLFLGVSI